MVRMDVLQEHRVVWVLFFFANGMLPLVNTIEGSFARTLIVCTESFEDSPGVLFSGSARCGDRLLVINEGQQLSSFAASFEGVAKALMMLAAAVVADAYGRRPVLLAGLACTAVSVAAFILACLADDYARPLFITGQVLQGAFPVELLFQLVAADLAGRRGDAGMEIYELQGAVKFLPVVIFGFVASAIQMLEPRSYLLLWCCVLCANCSLLAISARLFPETRAFEPTKASVGVVAGVSQECGEFRKLIADVPGLSMAIAYVSVDAIARARFSTLIFSFSMSYYDMTSADVVMFALPIILIHTLSTPLVGVACRRLGMRRGFVAVCGFKSLACCLFVLQPFRRWAFFLQYYLSSTASGWDALMSSTSTAIFGSRVSKYMALSTIAGYGANAVAAPMYAYAFDAKASAFWDRVRPGLWSFSLHLFGTLLLFAPSTGAWRLFRQGLDSMQRDADAKSE